MALIPTGNEIIEAQEFTVAEIESKIEAQKELGKEFILDEHSSGVIPETVWQDHKENV